MEKHIYRRKDDPSQDDYSEKSILLNHLTINQRHHYSQVSSMIHVFNYARVVLYLQARDSPNDILTLSGHF